MCQKKLYILTLVGLLLIACTKETPLLIPGNTIVNKAPEVSDITPTFIVAENISSNEIIGKVDAKDPDDDEIFFEIIDDDDALFEISSSGELHLANGRNLDFDRDHRHMLTVIVSDANGNTEEVQVRIRVTKIMDTLAEDPNAFVTKWRIPSDDFELVIGTNTGLTYNFTIDWGDGTVEELSSLTDYPSHTYENAGTYTVAILGNFPAIQMYYPFDNVKNNKLVASQQTLIGIEQWGTITWESFEAAFGNCLNLSEYNAQDKPDLSMVQSMTGMFYNAPVFNGAIGEWDVSNVEDMSLMFSGAKSFNQDIGGWMTSKVTNMRGMFFEATSFNTNIGDWDTSEVANMSFMFARASAFNQDIGNWNTVNVTTVENIFESATSFNQDISTKANGTSWNTSNITDMGSMFAGATKFNMDIGNWDTSNVELMTAMFFRASSFNQNLENWDTSNVIGMFYMFFEAIEFDQNLGSWDIGNVGLMGNMLNSSGMSPQNYSDTLIGWAAQNPPNNVSLGAVSLQYLCIAGQAHNNLINSGWTIIDDGLAEICP